MTTRAPRTPAELRAGAAGPLPSRHRRSTSTVAALATLLALWLGLDAPSVSPVAPSPVQVVQVDQVLPLPAADPDLDRRRRR